jgi:hypothetical protein
VPTGSPRPTAGRRKGFKFKSTLLKEQARELVRKMITERMGELIASQMDNAAGIKHLMYRDPATGKFERVTGTDDQIDAALKMGNAFWIYTKDPSVQAFSDLLNRALDKPAEQVTISGDEDKPIVMKWQSQPN